jgi:hypothetical protein
MNPENQSQNPETLAFEGISVDFKFNSNKPTFGDLFLITGFENPNKPPNSREFEKLNHLGFEQTDDYFGIQNNSNKGDDVRLWLFPLKKGEEVHHDDGPFDALRLTYIVVRNEANTAGLFHEIFIAFKSNLDVTPTQNGRPIDKFDEIEKTINETIHFCRETLKVEPGSDEALQLDW